MRRDVALLAVSTAWVVVTWAGFAVPVGPFGRAVLAAPLVFVLPGAALLRALRVDLAAPGCHALTVGLSMALCLLGGLLLAWIGSLTPLGWLSWLSLATLGGALVALRRGKGTPLVWPPLGFRTRHVALFGAVLGVLTVTALNSVRNREAYLPFPYTQFWMLAEKPASNLYTIGIKSGERDAQRFTIRVMVDGAIVGIWTDIAVAPGQTATRAVALPQGRRAEAWLLRGAGPVEVYRQVSASLPGSADVARD